MELVGHDFYLYIDSETGAPAAAYRRRGLELRHHHPDRGITDGQG